MSEFLDVVVLLNPEDESIYKIYFEDDHGNEVHIPQVFDEPYWERYRIQHDTIEKI